MRDVSFAPASLLVSWVGWPLAVLVLTVMLAVTILLVRRMCRALAEPEPTAEVIQLPVVEEREAA